MADINIPGVTDKYKTNDLIKNLMEAEKVPLTREQKQLDRYKTEQSTWRNVNAQMSALRDSVKLLYSFDNPFNSKLASSTDEYAVSAEPKRDANLESFKIEVLQAAAADRFLSEELDSKAQVPAGTYEYGVKDKTIKFNWKGGKLTDFAAALNRRAEHTIKASVIGVTSDKQALLIESLITGSENRLTFSGAAKDFALATGMIGKSPVQGSKAFSVSRDNVRDTANLTSKTLSFTEENITLPPRSGFEAEIPQKIRSDSAYQIRFSARVQDMPQEEIYDSQPSLPSSGFVQFKDITLANEDVDTKLEKTEQAVAQEPVEDFTAVFIKNSDGTEIPLEALKTDGEDSAYRIDTKEFPNVQSIVVKNNNTHKKIILTAPETINTSAAGDFIPLHPADIASDAKIKYQGITVTRPTNSMDDVVPNVTLNVHAKTEKPATITISSDTESAKQALITFVGKYNRLVAEINILTQTKPEIISELEYFTEEEAKEAEKRLGIFQTEFSLTNGKSSLQNIIARRYPGSEDASITMLSQIGISTGASTGGFAGVSPGRLRGYLEIDEKKLDSALKTNMRDIKNLFGYDSEGDLVADTGIAYMMDKNLQSFTQVGGIIASKTSTLNGKMTASQKNIDSLEKKLKQKENDLKVKYGQMESALNSLEKQSDSIKNFADNQNSTR